MEPARGQMVLAEAMPPILQHVIDGLGVYLVPRSDGKILIGATVEFVGYDKRTTLEGTREMIEAGIELNAKPRRKIFCSDVGRAASLCKGRTLYWRATRL